MFASYDWFLSYLDELGKVTPEDVQRVARSYLRRQSRTMGVYLPVMDEELPS
jgi:predicted Zn-dependent peptidase